MVVAMPAVILRIAAVVIAQPAKIPVAMMHALIEAVATTKINLFGDLRVFNDDLVGVGKWKRGRG